MMQSDRLQKIQSIYKMYGRGLKLLRWLYTEQNDEGATGVVASLMPFASIEASSPYASDDLILRCINVMSVNELVEILDNFRQHLDNVHFYIDQRTTLYSQRIPLQQAAEEGWGLHKEAIYDRLDYLATHKLVQAEVSVDEHATTWCTRDKKELLISDMDTQHLINVLNFARKEDWGLREELEEAIAYELVLRQDLRHHLFSELRSDVVSDQDKMRYYQMICVLWPDLVGTARSYWRPRLGTQLRDIFEYVVPTLQEKEE